MSYVKIFNEQGLPLGFKDADELSDKLGDARVKLYDEKQRLVGFRAGGGGSTPTITPALPVTLDEAAGNVEFTISPVSSMPSSLVIVDEEDFQDDIIPYSSGVTIFGGKSSLVSSVVFDDNSVKFTLARLNADAIVTSFSLG